MRLAKGEGKLSGLFGRKRELRQLKAQPPLAELAVDAAQAADAALAAQESPPRGRGASITTESTEDNSPLARAAAAALAVRATDRRRPSTTRRLRSAAEEVGPARRPAGGKVDRKGSTRRRCATVYREGREAFL